MGIRCGSISVIEKDVGDDVSVFKGVVEVVEACRRIDVLISKSGIDGLGLAKMHSA